MLDTKPKPGDTIFYCPPICCNPGYNVHTLTVVTAEEYSELDGEPSESNDNILYYVNELGHHDLIIWPNNPLLYLPEERSTTVGGMKTFNFDLILSQLYVEDEQAADRFFEAGCDDALFSLSGSVPCLAFAREAPSLRVALLSAFSNVKDANVGAQVLRVESEDIVTEAQALELASLFKGKSALEEERKAGEVVEHTFALIKRKARLSEIAEELGIGLAELVKLYDLCAGAVTFEVKGHDKKTACR